MGRPMAANLARAGLLSQVFNRTPAVAEAFAADFDVTVAGSPAELTAEVDVVAVCVSADEDLAEVIEQMGPGLERGKIVVDHSTISPSTARRIGQRLHESGVVFVDAPVTGGVEGAISGSLAIMVGGPEAAIPRLAPAFQAIGRLHRHLGPTGSGQAAKAVNQLMVAGIAEAVCEALALMEQLELPTDEMLELLSGGAAGSWFLNHRGKSLLERRFDTGFAPALLVKDLRICESLAAEKGLDSSVLRQALADFSLLAAHHQDDRDISALIRIKSSRN